MSDDGRSTAGPALGETALVVVCILALLLSAAFLPSFDPLGSPNPPGETSLPGSGSGVGAGSGAAGGETTTRTRPGNTPTGDAPGSRRGRTSGSAGSPTGGTLSMPSRRSRIGTTSERSVTSIDPVPLFVVESPRSTYWRQTAYSRYTGTSWTRSTEWRPLESGVPNDDLTADAAEMTYRVRLLQSSRSLPTAWQPETARLSGANASLDVSTVGAIRTRGVLPENATYVARSSMPPRDASALTNLGREYPERIEERYLRLPPSTPDRVARFTDRLTEGADDPYEVAVRIRDWLRTNKEYSLNASHEPGEPIAAQFLFEMEKGYCQYFATTMAVMLRTQGIPSRYVVGFAGGRSVGEGTFLVTSDRAHAWVEAYFPGAGWIRFDPTAPGDLPVASPEPPYEVSLNRSAVAGAPVSIAVEKNGSAVVGAPVYVNGNRVGWTGSSGEVSTTLPYTANVTITAREPGAESKYDGGTRTRRQRVAGASGGGLPVRTSEDGRAYAISLPRTVTQVDANASSATYRSETNVTVRIGGDPVVGGTVVVNATIDGVPVRNGTVELDGRPIGETNRTGYLELSLAGVGAGEHVIVVSRGAARGNATITVKDPSATPTTATSSAPSDPASLRVSVRAPLGFPLPAGPATVNVTRGGQPAPGVTVRLGGTPVGETGANGSLGIALPFSDRATIRVVGPSGATARTTVSGLYRNAAVFLLGMLAPLVGIALLARRFGITPRSVSRWLSAILSAIAARVVHAILRVASMAVRMGTAVRGGLARLAALLVGFPERLLTEGLAALRALDPRRFLLAVRRWLRELRRPAGSDGAETSGPDASRTRDAVGSDAESGPRATRTLRDLWREFVSLVRPPGAATRTPGEIARYAVDRGLPEEPVEYLTEAYREAEYGGGQPDESRLDRAREALGTIRERGDEQ